MVDADNIDGEGDDSDHHRIRRFSCRNMGIETESRIKSRIRTCWVTSYLYLSSINQILKCF